MLLPHFCTIIFVVLLSPAAVRDDNICQYWPICKMHHYFQCNAGCDLIVSWT